MHNPYSPPAVRVADVAPPKKGSGTEAVMIGLLVGKVCYFFASILLTIIGVIVQDAQRVPQDRLMGALSHITSASVEIADAVIGFLFSVLGGYLCVRIAKHSEYKLGLILLGINLAAFVFAFVVLAAPSLKGIVLMVLSVVSTMAGIQLGVLTNRADSRPPVSATPENPE
jgi:hypothetical protein